MTEVNGVKYDENIFQLTSSRRGWRSIMLFIWYTSIFQLTSSRRGWPAQQTLDQLLRQFQLTSSRRGWHDGRCVKSCCSYFNSHPHEEDDVFSSPQVSFYKHFNSHPHEKDDGSLAKSIFGAHYFNSHPHEEDDNRSNCAGSGTLRFQLTSTPTGLLMTIYYSDVTSIFQLTSSRRGWRLFAWRNVTMTDISTHILTKRMTVFLSSWILTVLFQLTSSRRGWLAVCKSKESLEYLKSQPHKEYD